MKHYEWVAEEKDAILDLFVRGGTFRLRIMQENDQTEIALTREAAAELAGALLEPEATNE